MTKHGGKKKLTRGEKWLLVAPLFVLLTFSCAKIALSQTAVRCSVSSVEDSFAKLPLAKQEAFFREMRRKGYLVFRSVPGFWSSADDLSTLFFGLSQVCEPLTKPMLDAVERNFERDTNKTSRSLAAQILYRYHRTAGRVFLLQQLEKRDVEAATIFALNRDAALLPQILKALDTKNEDAQNDPGLLQALGSWRRAEIKSALLKHFQIALNEEQNGWLNYVYALANQDAREAIPLIRRSSKAIIPGEDFETDSRICIAAAFVRLRAPESARSMQYLQQQLQAKEKAFSRRTMVEALGIAATTAAITTLQQIIKRYLASPPPLKNPPYHAIVDTTDTDELAVLAAKELGILQHKPSQNLIAALLVRLKKDNPTQRATLIEYSNRTGSVLLGFNTNESQATAKNVLGTQWLNRESALRQLNKVDSLSAMFFKN